MQEQYFERLNIDFQRITAYFSAVSAKGKRARGASQQILVSKW